MSASMQDWIGYYILLDCGQSLGKFEGQVCSVNTDQQVITLTHASQNGSLIKLPSVTINACDIKKLKILKSPEKIKSNHGTPTQETELVCLGGRVIANDNIDEINRNRSDTRKPHTPRKILDRRYRNDRDEDCFGTPVDNFMLENEFDFEKNLALFDKEAVFKKLSGKPNNTKPDIVQQTDETQNSKHLKYKNDENVLDSKPVTLQQITVPYQRNGGYVTDSGLIVPSITPELRRKILRMAEKHGLDESRQFDMLGRSASEMVLQLLGGSHRFTPKNLHQKPSVVVMCGPSNTKNAQAVNCARHLANHDVHVHVVICHESQPTPAFINELSLFKMSTGRVCTALTDLKNVSTDIVVSALDCFSVDLSNFQKESRDWINSNKAPVYSIDPDDECESLQSKWCIVPVLPYSYKSNDVTKIYLCDIGIPHDIFSKVGINYHSPFGHKFVIALHHNEC